MKKRKLLCLFLGVLIFLVLVFTISRIYINKEMQNEYSRCIDEDGNTLLSDMDNPYAQGHNRNGVIMFIDSKAAFEAAKVDYQLSLNYLKEHTNLMDFSYKKSTIELYKQQAWEANPINGTENAEDVRKNLIQFSEFLDILENSFR